jgi:hypothetical protein
VSLLASSGWHAHVVVSYILESGFQLRHHCVLDDQMRLIQVLYDVFVIFTINVHDDGLDGWVSFDQRSFVTLSIVLGKAVVDELDCPRTFDSTNHDRLTLFGVAKFIKLRALPSCRMMLAIWLLLRNSRLAGLTL